MRVQSHQAQDCLPTWRRRSEFLNVEAGFLVNCRTGQKEHRSQNLKVLALCLKLTHICLNQVRCVLLSFHFLIYEITVTPGLQSLREFSHSLLLSLSLSHTYTENILFFCSQASANTNELIHGRYRVEQWWPHMEVLTDFTSPLLFSSMGASSSSQGVSIQLNMASVKNTALSTMSSHSLFGWLSSIHCSVHEVFIAWFSPVFEHVTLAAITQQPDIPLYPFHQGTFIFKVFLGKIFRFIVVFLYEDFNFFAVLFISIVIIFVDNPSYKFVQILRGRLLIIFFL